MNSPSSSPSDKERLERLQQLATSLTCQEVSSETPSTPQEAERPTRSRRYSIHFLEKDAPVVATYSLLLVGSRTIPTNGSQETSLGSGRNWRQIRCRI